MKTSKNVVDSAIRTNIFNTLNIANIEGFQKINDRQFGILVTDVNGVERYARVGVIVAEEREDMSASELMMQEINTYLEKQSAKEKRAAERKAKAERDKAKREAEKKEKEKEGE